MYMNYHYYMFNKPFGCVTAHRDERETEGLLIITDDGVWNQQMIHPAYHVPKTYTFMAMGTLDEEKLKYNLSDHPVVCGEITVTEGKKRQIRRMLKAVGCCVIFLKRISIGDIVLDRNLKPGEFKEITVK